MAEATLDEVVANQQTIIEKLTQLSTKLDSVKTSTETAINNTETIGTSGVYETGVDSKKTFVVSPWPPTTEGE
jgi:hypothetical protein